VVPDFDFASAPPIDLLVVPGGFGTRGLLRDEATLAWIRRTAAAARRVTSVCTGALLLARVGLLAGRRATTHWGALALLAEVDPTIRVEPDSGGQDGIITSAGVWRGSTWRWPSWSLCAGAPWRGKHYMAIPRQAAAVRNRVIASRPDRGRKTSRRGFGDGQDLEP
jgi:putative intracellular protease/amidase